LLREAVRLGRQHHPYIFENFEWLAARAQRWADEHPYGDYPAAIPRMIELNSSQPKPQNR
jgi:hypothetical protein